MASKLFTEGMGRGAHLLPFLEEELRAVSAVSKDANKSVESHLHLLFPPVQGKNTTNVQSYNKNESLYIPENKFAGDIFYLCVENLGPYTKNSFSLTFWDMMFLLNIETRVQKWFKGYQNYEQKKLVDIVPDIIQKYYANDIGVTIELTSSDNKSSASWFFKKVLRPSFLSRRKSLKSLKRSSKSAKKRRVLKNKSKNKRSAKSRRR
jgi:hypothetical protein